MSTKTLFIAVGAGIFLTVSTLAVHLERTNRETERMFLNGVEQRARLEPEIETMEARLMAAEADRARAHHTLESLRAKAVPASLPSPPKNASSANEAAVRIAALNDPHVQALQLAAARGSLAPLYGPLFRRLGLSVSNSEQAEMILAKRAEKNADLSAAAQSQGLKPDDLAILKLRQQADDEFRRAQTALLGEDGYRQFQVYERELPARAYVDQFAGTAALAGAPVTGEQADQIVEIMLAASAEYQTGDRSTLMTMDWEKIFERAATILPAAQLHVFKTMGVRNQIRRRLQDVAESSAPPH